MGLFDSLKNKASNLIDTGSNKLKETARLPGRIVHSSASIVRNEWDDIKHVASKAKNKVVRAARDEWNDTKHAASTVKHVASTAKNKVVRAARDEWSDTKRLASKAKNKVVRAARDEWSDTKRLVSKAKDKVVRTARDEWSDTKRLASKAKNKVVRAARDEWNDTKRLVSKAKDKVVRTARDEWDDTKHLASKAKNSLTSASRGIKEFIGGNPKQAIDSARSAFKALTSSGKSWQDRVKIVDQWWDKTQPHLGLLGQQMDVSIGFTKGAWDAGKGVYSLATNPVFNPNAMVIGLATNPKGTIQKSQNTIEGMRAAALNPAVQSVVSLPALAYNFTTRPQETTRAFKDLGSAFASPYVDAWKSGHPGEAVGRGIFDIGSFFVPGGAVTKVGKGAEVANVVAKAARVEEATTIAAKAAKVKEVQAGLTEVIKGDRGSIQLRDARGRFISDPNRSPALVPKHKSPEYQTARADLKKSSIDDPNLPSFIRGWLRNEQNQRGNNPRNWRNPLGYDTGHGDPNDNTRLRWETRNQNRSRGARFKK